MASLWTWDPDKDAEEGRSIGVGFTPGDTTCPVPYIYVTPWPYPENTPMPALSAGHWHTDQWVGAVLTLEELGPADRQGARVATFVEEAVAGRQSHAFAVILQRTQKHGLKSLSSAHSLM